MVAYQVVRLNLYQDFLVNMTNRTQKIFSLFITRFFLSLSLDLMSKKLSIFQCDIWSTSENTPMGQHVLRASCELMSLCVKTGICVISLEILTCINGQLTTLIILDQKRSKFIKIKQEIKNQVLDRTEPVDGVITDDDQCPSNQVFILMRLKTLKEPIKRKYPKIQ